MSETKFPVGWDEDRVRRVLDVYENQTDAEALAEDEGILHNSETLMTVSTDLVPAVRELIAKRRP